MATDTLPKGDETMEFALTPEQEALRDMLRSFVAREVRPKARAWDETGEFPGETVAKLGELGILGAMVPEEYGGAGMDTVSYAIAVEEIAKGDGSLGLTVASHNSLCTAHILGFGSEEIKRRYLPGLVSGKTLGSWALSVTGSGSVSLSIPNVLALVYEFIARYILGRPTMWSYEVTYFLYGSHFLLGAA